MNQPIESAMERYLKDLRQVLSTAPKAAREDALRDAAEFLSNEISSPDAMHLAESEQLAYDHFIESYGSPSQVATEYLQSQATTSNTMSLPNRWKYLSILNAALLIGLVTAGVFLMDRSDPWPTRSSLPPKVSPFTQVDFEEDKILVEFDGATYEWLDIDGIPVSKVTAASKRLYRVLWRKRIVEDLVEVLWGMGHKPGETVKLQLRELEQNEEITIAAAPMTHANRQSMYGNYPVCVNDSPLGRALKFLIR